jgi:hypothetical protein
MDRYIGVRSLVDTAFEETEMSRRRGGRPRRFGGVAEEAKHLFSYEGSLAVPLCAFAVGSLWVALRILSSFFDPLWCPLITSFILVFGLTVTIPEPNSHLNRGQRKLTRDRIIFGIIVSLTVFVLVAGFDCLLTQAIRRSIR